MQLELNRNERDLLVRILKQVIGDTRVEVRRTKDRSFHDNLVREEECLKTLLSRLEELVPAG